MDKESRWSDERVEEVMGNLLRAGISLAAAVVLTGGIFYLIRYHSTSPGYRVFRGEPADLRSVSGILADAIELRSRGLIQLAFSCSWPLRSRESCFQFLLLRGSMISPMWS